MTNGFGGKCVAAYFSPTCVVGVTLLALLLERTRELTTTKSVGRTDGRESERGLNILSFSHLSFLSLSPSLKEREAPTIPTPVKKERERERERDFLFPFSLSSFHDG